MTNESISPQTRLIYIPQFARPALALGLVGAWTWLVLRGYGDPSPFVFNDERGALFGTLPAATVCLAIFAAIRRQIPGPILWNLACAALCTPTLLDLSTGLRDSQILRIVFSIMSGYGFAVTFMAIGAKMSFLNIAGIIAATCGGIICACAIIQMMLWLYGPALVLLPVVFALLLKLLLGCQPMSGPSSNMPNIWGMTLTMLLAGFSFGLYGSLMVVMVPLLPRPQVGLLLLFATAASISGASIYMARGHLAWRIGLLICPFLLVGYTAWPILHRESPAISLLSLHLANIFMGTLAADAIFFIPSQRFEKNFQGACPKGSGPPFGADGRAFHYACHKGGIFPRHSYKLSFCVAQFYNSCELLGDDLLFGQDKFLEWQIDNRKCRRKR